MDELAAGVLSLTIPLVFTPLATLALIRLRPAKATVVLWSVVAAGIGALLAAAFLRQRILLAEGAHFIDASPLSDAINVVGIALVAAMSIQSFAISTRLSPILPTALAFIGMFVVSIAGTSGVGGVLAIGLFLVWLLLAGVAFIWQRRSGPSEARARDEA